MANNLDFGTARALVNRLYALRDLGDPIELRDHGLDTIRFLDSQAVLLGALAEELPEDSWPADVFADGVGLANQAEAAAALFAEEKVEDFELHAVRICANMTCSVQGEEHHVVGPRMLAMTDCMVRHDRVESALTEAEAIVADFEWILDEYLETDELPTVEDRVSLETLKVAQELLTEHNSEASREICSKIASVLSRTDQG